MNDIKKDLEFINKNHNLNEIPHDLGHLVNGSFFKKMVERQVEMNASFVRILNELGLQIERLQAELLSDKNENREKMYLNKEARIEPSVEGFDYYGFEKAFRPDEAIIKERQRQYLELFTGKDSVIDIGCGRGEFMELMKENGIDAIGIDLNTDMVARCEAKGLNVKKADGMEYLKSLTEASAGGVFSAQFIEHIPFDLLDAFVKLSYKKLKPDGVFVAETINPYNPIGFKFFYVDPTHIKPLYPEVIEFLCKSAGFENVKIKYLPSIGSTEEGLEAPWDYPDYAVIAKK